MGRCSICDHGCKLVHPTGPLHSDVLLVGEKPGVFEDRIGKCFVGDTGKELDLTYLPLAGLDRRNVRITNCVRCRLGGSNTKPTTAQIHACASHHLPTEIAECQPDIIVLMGSTACSLMPEIELDKQHGIPQHYYHPPRHYFGDWFGWILPMYHPAVGLHKTSMMILMLDDFKRFGLWLAGNYNPLKATVGLDYRHAATKEEVDKYFDDYT